MAGRYRCPFHSAPSASSHCSPVTTYVICLGDEVPIIVAGKLTIKTGLRDEFIEKSSEAVLLARGNHLCEDFSVSPDPIDINRANIFEKWKTRSALEAFREAGPDNNVFSLVESFDVNEYEVST